MPAFHTLDSFDFTDKIVLVRADLNVPMSAGRVTDATRITRFAPTAKELAAKGAKVVILSHFGRPKACEAEFSLKPLIADLAAAIGLPVGFASDCLGDVAEKAIAALNKGDVLLLENVRYYKEEEKNDAAFTAKLAALGDFYVNDAFSAAHRAHASTAGLAALLPAAAGRLMQAELEALQAALGNPQRPVMAVVGGSKVSSKLGILRHLVQKVDMLLIGGAMANTFLLAQGKAMGKSLVESDLLSTAQEIIALAETSHCALLLPQDVVVAKALQAGTPSQTISVDALEADDLALDIGAESVQHYISQLERCKTVVWNGPLGAFEIKPFNAATNALAQAVAARTKTGALLSVAGGGDTVSALEGAGVAADFTYVSSAGGAFLEWLEGITLPGVAALENACKQAA